MDTIGGMAVSGSVNADIGVIGLAVMGQNLALNMENKGFRVAVYNRTGEKTKEFMAQRGEGKNIFPAYTLEEFVQSLARPRKVMLMVKAGAAVDAVIDQLLELLEPGDVIIDGGNSFFADTDRRTERVEAAGLHYLGTGVSGGEYGALHGPSIMPGGTPEAYQIVEPIFSRIAAQTDDGPCCAYMGSGSAGHYVKMVHNGIEYGIMQVLAESYDLMHRGLGLTVDEVQKHFAEWNANELNSYLVEITAEILARMDEDTGQPLVSVIKDQAQQKGTGKWTSQSALDFGIPVPTITAAVDARILSSFKPYREKAAQKLVPPDKPADLDANALTRSIRAAVYLSVVAAYAQGMQLIAAASIEKNYGVTMHEVARIWKDGCIIRSVLLDPIQQAYKDDPELHNLLFAEPFTSHVNERIADLRETVIAAVRLGIPVPALSASLAYIDSYRSERLPANLTQAQRDYFGAHTYERTDKPGTFHTPWQDIHSTL
mgnify:CR=1 FL=1